MSSIEVAGVGKSYDSATVLESIDLVVADGSKTVIVGASGSGKTTLLRLICGFEFPDSGTIRVGDRTVAGLDPSGADVSVQAHRRDVGYVAQDGALFPHLTVGENIAFGLSTLERRLRRTRVQELLELVSLEVSLESRRPDQLSGGQQQRVALARALAREPKVMLLDEPFSALDFALRAATRDLVAEALTTARITTILVTHDRAEALAFGDQLAVLRDGRLVQVGAPGVLYSDPVDVSTARFLGEAVVLDAKADDLGSRTADPQAETALGTVPVALTSIRGNAVVMFRPEQLRVTVDEANIGRVVAVEFHGPEMLLSVQLDAGDAIIRVPVAVSTAIGVGQRVGVHVLSAGRVFAD